MAAETAAPVPGRLIARNASLNMLGLGLPVVVALGAMPVLARGLDAAHFGLLGLAWLVLGYANELGFGRATTKFVAEAMAEGSSARVAEAAWTTILLQAALGVAAGVVLAVAAPLLSGRVLRLPSGLAGEATAVFQLLAAAVPLIVTAAAVRGVLEAAQRFDLVNVVRGPVTASNFLLPLAGVLAGWGMAVIVALLVVARAIALAAYLGLALRVAPVLARWPGRGQRLAPVLRFGGWTTVSGMASPLLIYLDRFLVGALVSIAAVAYYTAPYEVAARLLIVPASLVGTLFPAFSGLQGRNDLNEAARLGARGVKYTLLLVGPVAVLLIAIAPDLLGVWLGPAYAREGALALQLLAAGIVVNAVAHVPVSLLHGIGRADLPARFHLLELPVHLMVASALILLLGVPGAALAWGVRACLDATLLFGAARRVTPLSHELLRTERVPQTALLLAGMAAAAAATVLLPTAPLRLSAGALVTLVAAGASWRYAVGAVERARLLRLLTPAGAR